MEVTACLVWKDWPHRVHPHSLVGKDCTDGVCRVRLRPHVSPRHRYLTPDPQPFIPGHGDMEELKIAWGSLRARDCLARFSPLHFLDGETKARPGGGGGACLGLAPCCTHLHTLLYLFPLC